jgi:pyruvate/2-oxoglutarate dehydrogenase complex dihydrolipoamide dehydrogenase (E3) component
MEKVDVIVIGSGQGGVPLATDLAGEGKNVVLFEKGDLGGSCINYGCRPSKSLLASALTAACGRSGSVLGVRVEVAVDFPSVMQRAREVSMASREGIGSRLANAGVHVIAAEASFSGERIVEGGGAELQADLVVINTGNAPFVPPVNGLAGTPFMTYLNFWQLEALPGQLLIIGGGYVGVEIGQAMARLGSETHIIEMQEHIIGREEQDVIEIIEHALAEDGVHLHLGSGVSEVAHDQERFTLTLEGGETLSGDALLVAIGQQPNTGALNTGASGIDLNERGFIKVDERFETTCPGVYAIGDVTGQPAFTNVSWEDYRRLKSILAGGNRKQGDRVLAYAFFTEPQVGRVGMTLDEAEKQGYRARAVKLPLDWVSMAYILDQTDGFYRLVVDLDTEKILGATLVGPVAGELVHVILAHMEAGSSWRLLEQSVHIHPTLAEGLPSTARLLLD